MKVFWLGQAGLLFEFNGVRVMVDPYLSNSVEKVEPKNYRRLPIDESYFDIKPDILILTHNHIDHTDPETLEKLFLRHSGICVLASYNAWQTARKFGGDNNYVMFNRGTVWTEKGIKFEAVYAEHSDDKAVGVIISYGGRNYYITGDTLYNKKVIKDINIPIDVVFLPINGVGNNMNMTDAAHFAGEIKAKTAVPIHFGMFDSLNAGNFGFKNRVIPEIYKEIKL